MTATMRAAYHKFTYRPGDDKRLLLNLSRTNSMRPTSRWTFNQENENAFSGSQNDIYFYAVANHKIEQVTSVTNDKEKITQEKLNILMDKYFNMGKEGLAFAGMDDEGGLSSWYVLNALGLYTFSPADPEYIITVPLFDKVVFDLDGTPFTITKVNHGEKITHITYDGRKIDGYFISHDELKKGKIQPIIGQRTTYTIQKWQGSILYLIIITYVLDNYHVYT